MRAVIADDEVLLRAGLARLLEDHGFEVAAQVGSADELIRAVAETRPNVAVVDIRMPPTQSDEGLRAAEELIRRHERLGIVVLSHYLESRYAALLLNQRSWGMGYLLKHRVANVDAFVDGVRRVARGEAVVDPEVVQALMSRQRAGSPLGELTARERELLGLMAEGRSNAAICRKLFLSPKTVEGHVRNIFMKLGLPEADDDNRRVLAVLTYLRA